jgi:hypothetical protein
MKKLPAVLALAVVAVVSVASASAHAKIEPKRAEKDLNALRYEGKDAFCKNPSRPISIRARGLCDHAKEVPDCGGFVTACEQPPGSDLPTDPKIGKASPQQKENKPSHLELPAFLGTLAHIAVWILVAAIVVAILVPVILAIARLRRDKKASEDAGEKDESPAAAAEEALATISDAEVLLRKADERARAGELDLALHLYLGASLRALDQRGAIRLSRDRTNGEYVRGCREDDAKAPLREIVREVDRVQFGGETPSPDGVTRAKSRAVSLVRRLPLAVLSLALVVVLGACGGGEPTAPAWTNPAGSEVMQALLLRQGVSVKPLGQPISSIAMPAEGTRGPTVIVDLEITKLDDDARSHLLAWVEAGGVLVLAGRPGEWPYELRVKQTFAEQPGKVKVLQRMLSIFDDDDPDENGDYVAQGHAQVVRSDAIVWPSPAEPAAWEGDAMYAGLMKKGKGAILGLATDELLTNVALSRAGNAEALMWFFTNLEPKEVRIASEEDGISPPADPVSAMSRAGLGLGMWHALLASIVLFFAVGARLARPRPVEPPRRRAFTEHLDATGALYARARLAPHALASYARYAEERLHARMPRGTTDVPQFLASRAGADLATCQRVWARATNARGTDPPRGDELSVLKELSALFSAAVR